MQTIQHIKLCLGRDRDIFVHSLIHPLCIVYQMMSQQLLTKDEFPWAVRRKKVARVYNQIDKSISRSVRFLLIGFSGGMHDARCIGRGFSSRDSRTAP